MLNAPGETPATSLSAIEERESGAPLGRSLRHLLTASLAVTLFLAAISVATVGADAAAGATSSPPARDTGLTGPTGVEDGITPAPDDGGSTSIRRQPVKLAAHTKRIRFHGKVKVRGNSGLPFSSRVRVQFRPYGKKRWSNRTRLKTTRSGRFKGSFRGHRSGLVRVVDRSGRSSRTGKVTVRSRVRLGATARTVKLGQRLKISGRVLPKGSRRVRVRVNGAGKSVVVRTRGSGRFVYRWKPTRAGDVRIRALAFGNRKAVKSRSNNRRSSALRPGGASYYGPGLYGNGVACGGVLRPGMVGVAHKTLPCGTKVKFKYGNRLVSARVIDRGPYIAGRDWDLTAALRNKLGFGGVGTVWTNR